MSLRRTATAGSVARPGGGRAAWTEAVLRELPDWGFLVTDQPQWTTGGNARPALALVSMRAALLLADPDPHEPGYLSRNLASDGFDVVEAGWSAQALDIAERSRPDIA